jgi:hypothetical protein
VSALCAAHALRITHFFSCKSGDREINDRDSVFLPDGLT